MVKRFVLQSLIICALTVPVVAQDSTSHEQIFDEGLAIHGGVGFLALKDEYISDEVYSGTIPYFALTWSRQHDTYGDRAWLEYEYTPDLKNYNISAKITQFRLGIAFVYPIGQTNILSEETYFLLGPSSELFLHFRSENIADAGVSSFNSYSVAALFSGGVRFEALCPLSSDFQLHAMAQTTVLSLGGRIPNLVGSEEGEQTESPLKLLTLFSGLDAEAELGIHYMVAPSMFVAAGYRFELTRIDAWDFFISGNDNFILSVSYDL
jgi:hypothetical protein